MNGFGESPIEILAREAMLRGECWCDGYEYPARFLTGTPTALGSGLTAEVPININSGQDFIVQEVNLTAFDNAAPPVLVAAPNLLLTLVKGGSERNLQAQPVHVLNKCGAYQANKVPGRLSYPIFLLMQSTLTVQLQNLSTTVFSRVDVSFIGFTVAYTPESAAQGRAMFANRKGVFNL